MSNWGHGRSNQGQNRGKIWFNKSKYWLKKHGWGRWTCSWSVINIKSNNSDDFYIQRTLFFNFIWSGVILERIISDSYDAFKSLDGRWKWCNDKVRAFLWPHWSWKSFRLPFFDRKSEERWPQSRKSFSFLVGPLFPPVEPK